MVFSCIDGARPDMSGVITVAAWLLSSSYPHAAAGSVIWARDAPGGLTQLPAQAQALDERPVAGDVGLGQVLQQSPAPADEQQQPATAVVIVLVHLEVLGQVAN